MPPNQYKYFIGIDPGTATGFAVWEKLDKRFSIIQTMKIHNALYLVMTKWIDFREQTLVRVEDPRQAVFGRKKESYKAQGAGSIKRDASIWEDFLTDLKFNFQMIRPNKVLTKWTADQFRKRTGYTDRTSEHGRDAAMLVFDF